MIILQSSAELQRFNRRVHLPPIADPALKLKLDKYTVALRITVSRLPDERPLLPEILLAADRGREPLLPLVTEGVQRHVWKSSFGTMLIEARDGVAYVNGERVEPFVPAAPAPE